MVQHYLVSFGGQFPPDYWIVSKRLDYHKDRLLVYSQDAQDLLAGVLKDALSPPRLHGFDQHPGETKRDFLRVLWPHLCNLEAVSEVNVHHLVGISLHHYVVRMPVPKPNDEADNGHDCQAACETRAMLEPLLTVDRPDPEDVTQIVARYPPLDLPVYLDFVKFGKHPISISTELLTDVLLVVNGLSLLVLVLLAVILDKVPDGITVFDP